MGCGRHEGSGTLPSTALADFRADANSYGEAEVLGLARGRGR
ncbi:hypothetical protein [Streptomyces silvisoli]|uniref:DUF397 domain-containing protein n=1 Tax=Streptomyces silvisoli TaxID=3034235 RepID=A0ABT5ZIJ5_9ACTN|nr:hypothetical protein [Streptomyces silvisoli]MDF3289649.1 hypothetical protein [Streptomyces silvisoli]